MERLTVIGVEDDTLIVESAGGKRFGIAVTDVPNLTRRPSSEHVKRKASPREIQTLIRQGMTAAEVEKTTGEELEYIERFEAPVLAERAHILERARATPVASGDLDPLAGERTFESAMTERLDELGATGVEWLSWREVDRGWVIRLTFTADGNQTDAQWAFDHRKQTLQPLGKESKALSQSADPTSVLVPRLRPVAAQEPQSPAPQEAKPEAAAEPAASAAKTEAPEQPQQTRQRPQRFDSGAFRALPTERDSQPSAPELAAEEAPRRTGRDAAAARSSRPATEPSHTADLLDALRRRRTERDAAASSAAAASAPAEEEDTPLFQVEETEPAEKPAADDDGRHHTSPLSPGKRKGSRASMPSWDEIVFGSRGDDA
ncbi:septation protein SepH [Agrococcus casei]|uniref:septation protein SepH n=1 Tax=Agrococcus casei TaxID=343512 RepID=UPI003F902405